MARRRRGYVPIIVGVGIAAVVAGGAYLLLKGVGGKLGLTLNPTSIVHGAAITWTATGGTPGGTTKLEVQLNNGNTLTLTPTPNFDGSGTCTAQFTVGTNIPTGTNVVKVTDNSSGSSATASFLVTA